MVLKGFRDAKNFFLNKVCYIVKLAERSKNNGIPLVLEGFGDAKTICFIRYNASCNLTDGGEPGGVLG